jgi:ribosomal protein L11 methylase PrmA
VLPPGLLVRGSTVELGRAFPALVPLQPVRWTRAGLVCAPRAGELAELGPHSCPLPLERLDAIPGWPQPPAAMVGGWYRRSPGHAAAPHGTRELVQVEGKGFGLGGHPTTAMCLAALHHLPAGPALDAGCGSGLLAQAWARSGKGHVLACDLDPAAIAQTRSAAVHAGLAHAIAGHVGPVERLGPARTAGRVVLANLPASAQLALLAHLPEPPPAALVSGVHGSGARRVVAGYRLLGLTPVSAARRGRWECWALVSR